MEIKKTINYTLTIDKENGHHFNYEGSAENDTAGLLISCAVLEGNLAMLKDQKKKLTGREKRAMSEYISRLSAANATLKRISQELCDGYEEYVKKFKRGAVEAGFVSEECTKSEENEAKG